MNSPPATSGRTDSSVTIAAVSGSIAGSEAGIASVRAADAGGDRLLGGGMLLPDALRRGLDAVRGLEGFDPFGQFGNAWPLPFAWLLGRRRKARP